MSNLFTELNNVEMVLAPDADLYAADPATDVINMALYDHVTFLVVEGAGGTGTVKIEVEECTADDGTGNTAIAFNYRLRTAATAAGTWGALTASAATGYTTVAGANKMVAIEIDADQLSEASPFVRLQLTEVVDSPCDAAVLAILSCPKYTDTEPPSAIG